MLPIRVTQVPEAARRPKPDPDKLLFGHTFSDHMFLAEFTPEQGWHSARIEPYGELSLPPSTIALHYAQMIFEGMKAYRNEAGEVYLFRWRENAARFRRSAERLRIPPVEMSLFGEAIRRLVWLDRDWVPTALGSSLYIRPVIMATDKAIGMHASNNYLFFVICSPTASYFPKGFYSVSIRVSEEDVRAVQGGTGDVKCAGNYSGSLRALAEAKAKGFDQVLWLDAQERKYVEEVGSMNIFFKLDGTIITPPLSGTILPGVTRASVLELSAELGLPVEERLISIDEVMETLESGKMEEIFGAGTAVAIAPVGSLSHKGHCITVGNGSPGPTAMKLRERLLTLQRGETSDPYGWREQVLAPEFAPN